MIKDLKFVLRKGKGGGSKKTKKTGKNTKKNTENNDNETSGLFKKRSIFWNIGRTWCIMQLMPCMWRRMCVNHWSVPCWIYVAKPKIHLMHGWT
jgi:hypothetical protein